jgi:predicted phage replisome organizer
MPEVKWVKITTDMFDDEKIKIIEKMPDPDSLLIIWVKLICQAGRVNDAGAIYITENLTFNEEDLATVFNRPVNVIRLALKTFQRLGMIEVTDTGVIILLKWEKHQNLDGLERIRENGRKRIRAFREHQKLLTNPVTLHVTESNGAEGEGEGEKSRIRVEKNKEIREVREKESVTSPSTDNLATLEKGFNEAFGRAPDSREEVFLRDISIEINLTCVTEKQIHDAFREIALSNKLNLSYFRAILYSWLGIERK